MILKYLDKDDAAQQLQNLEDKGTEHDQHYDFIPLIQALKIYIDKYHSRGRDWDKLKEHWIKIVGSAQTQVPAHVANEYCSGNFAHFLERVRSLDQNTFKFCKIRY